MNKLSEFHAAIQIHGLTPPEFIEPGKFHRFPGKDKRRGNKAGWCVFFLDGEGGSFGDWSTGLIENWQTNREKPYTPAERAAFKRQVETARAAEKAARTAQHSEAATRAADLLAACSPAVFHPYLMKKKVLPLGIKQDGDTLAIPMSDIDGKLWSVQTINLSGQKRFMADGRVSGCFYLIGPPITDRVFICEGFATGASLFMHGTQAGTKGQPIAVAFYCANLKPVALAIRNKYPAVKITIAADNDAGNPSNPGLTKGREAAALVGGGIIWPNFTGMDCHGTDFNDYVNIGGLI